MRVASTTLRLAGLVFAFQITAATVLMVGIGVYLRWEMTQQTARMADVLRDDLLAVYGRDGTAGLERTVLTRSTTTITRGAVMLLRAPDGRITGNLAHWPAGLDQEADTAIIPVQRTNHIAPDMTRVRITPLPDGARLLTGVVDQGEERATQVFGDASLVALLLAILFAGATAWLSARIFTDRLREVVDTLSHARAGDLSRRVPPDPGRDAFAALGRAVNLTLDQIAGLVDGLRLATDALAHDLKSPITRMRSSLERARATLAAPDADPMLAVGAVEAAHAEGDRLLAIVETALSIRRAEAGLARDSFRRVDLPDMLEALAEIYGPVAEERGRTVAVAITAAHAHADIHRELLGQAIGNLIDNSLKYGAGAITLALDDGPEGLMLAVADQGPGIPPSQHDDALRRFGRLDSARGGNGAGLGLSLVGAVATLHGATLTLADAAPGLIVTIGPLPIAKGD